MKELDGTDHEEYLEDNFWSTFKVYRVFACHVLSHC